MQEILIQLNGQKRRIDLSKQPVTLGRHEESTIRLTGDPLISRFHCRLEHTPQGVVLRDLNSRNGTWVGGRKIDTVLVRGVFQFRVGQNEVLVQVAGAEVQAGGVAGVAAGGASGGGGGGAEAFDIPDLVDEDEPVGAAENLGRPSEVFKKGSYGIESIYQLAHIGANEPGVFGPESLEMLNARSQVVHAAGKSSGLGGGGASANTLDQLRLMLLGCVRSGASDIHLEPKRSGGQLRLRIDGAMVHICDLDPEDTKRLMSLIKILCDIDIAQKAVIQEGHFSCRVPGRRIDYRVSYTPAMNGQKMVVRVLDPFNAPQQVDSLGLPDWMRQRVELLARQDTGMLLVCGPTGSGKTTTLYALLRQIDAASRNIITIEDPVEYEIQGVTQMPVNVEQGASFLSLLRSCLRQDPDVVVLGEVRDKDTAVTAMQAATTGHLVMSTLHAKDAMGIIFRLLDLQVEPYLIASTLNILMSQRLVRKLCDHCKRPIKPSAYDLERLAVEKLEHGDLYEAVGCPNCFNTGYHGRLGVFEMLVATDAVRDAIMGGAGMGDIREKLKEGKFESLLGSGRKLILGGQTTLEEIDRTVGFGDI